MSAVPDAGLTVARTAFDDPVVRDLIAALDADLDARYAHDDEGEPDRSMLNVLDESVAPPLGTFLVAWQHGEAVGCGGLRPAPTGEAGVAEVKRMYVAPEARGGGVGRAILAGLEAAAAGLGYRRVILETGTRQAEAIALYESAGYRPIERYGAYRHSAISRCYAKDLPAPPAP